jgi:ubiquitin-protein ligase E3 C
MGIDGGGLFKEFMTDLLKEVFDSDRGLWLANKKNELYPSSGSYATERKSFLDDASFTRLTFMATKRTA